MEERLEAYLKNLQETTAAREKMASELRIARDIQMSMLPDRKQVREGRTEIDLAAALEPAREVGGDLYDFSLSITTASASLWETCPTRAFPPRCLWPAARRSSEAPPRVNVSIPG